MLLEMDNNELVSLLDDIVSLTAKVNEALVVLHEYSGKPEDGQA